MLRRSTIVWLFSIAVGLVGLLSFVAMDREADSDFFSLFLPFVAVTSLVWCTVLFTGWVVWNLIAAGRKLRQTRRHPGDLHPGRRL